MTRVDARQAGGDAPQYVPLIVIGGAPSWLGEARTSLMAAGYRVAYEADPAAYASLLVSGYVALILVDGDPAGWPVWLTPPKVDQATRRIPLFVVLPDDAAPSLGEAAAQAGADGTLTQTHLAGTLPALVQLRGRFPDAVRLAEVAAQCGESLPPLAREGVARFNAGEYYKQHDAFEALWMHDARPVRDLYQGILQIGVAYHHIQNSNYRGALKMLTRSAQWLALLPDECQGVDVARLRQDAAAARAHLLALGPDRLAEFDVSLFARVHWRDAVD